MNRKQRALLIPIDNRPVTYLFPQLVAQAADVEVVMPPRALMGSLTHIADFAGLNSWLQRELTNQRPDVLIVCLDTLLYGGLVASRRGIEPVEEVLDRLQVLSNLKQGNMQVFAQSAVTRIPNYDDNTEEPEYWSHSGRKLFHWSELQHKQTIGVLRDDGEIARCEADLDIRAKADFLWRRMRNHQVQRELLKYVQDGWIDFLVFSQDDSGKYGLNVLEKEQLIAESHDLGLSNVMAYAGADEVILTLLTRWLISTMETAPEVILHFSPPSGEQVASNFEGQTIGESLGQQCNAAGVTILDQNIGGEDLTIIVHTSGQKQGDHLWLPGHPDLRKLDSSAAVKQTILFLEKTTSPCILCDLVYSNGSDPDLIEELLDRPDLLRKLYSYAAWNTTGNTVGSAVALGVARLYAVSNSADAANTDSWRQAMFVRLADDWAYQTQVRPQLSGSANVDKLQVLMEPYLERIAAALGIKMPVVGLKFPWQRTFEVELCL